MRRFCVRNKCDRLGTLTYAPEHLPDDVDGVWRDVERFRKRLRKLLGQEVPMAAVIERGSKNGRLHVHLAIGSYVAKEAMAEAWGRGFVEVRKLKVAGHGGRERCRRAAAYISKYLAKEAGTAESDRGFNRRRYSVSKGFTLVPRSFAVQSRGEGLALAQELETGEVVWWWSSADDPDWCGPPVTVMHFGDP